MTEDLSVTDVLHDPLIRQMLRADRISLPRFAVFLNDAMRRQGADHTRRLQSFERDADERTGPNSATSRALPAPRACVLDEAY